jgi:preprotein translocase subunit SecG
MSGAITGSADTFFGQSKANTWDRMLSKLTIVVSAIFAIAVILMYALVG